MGKNFIIGVLMVGAAAIPAQVQAAKKVYAPYVEKGELELEYRGGYDIDGDSDKNDAWKQKYAIGYGFTNRWFSEIYAEFKKSGARGADSKLNSIEWENRFVLTEAGQYWADFGVLSEIKYNVAGGADKAELKGLVAKDVGKFTHLANVILEREFGEDAADEAGAGLAWSSRYRYKPYFEPAIELYSDFGSLSDGSSFDEEKHQLGVASYGKVGQFKYDVGVLFGASDAAPDASVKMLFEYEWHF